LVSGLGDANFKQQFVRLLFYGVAGLQLIDIKNDRRLPDSDTQYRLW
jgi:hypothetical protein